MTDPNFSWEQQAWLVQEMRSRVERIAVLAAALAKAARNRPTHEIIDPLLCDQIELLAQEVLNLQPPEMSWRVEEAKKIQQETERRRQELEAWKEEIEAQMAECDRMMSKWNGLWN